RVRVCHGDRGRSRTQLGGLRQSLHSGTASSVPKDTARIARAASPKGNRYMQERDALVVIYDDANCAGLFSLRGQLVETLWRLAPVTTMQFAKGRSDRRAAELVISYPVGASYVPRMFWLRLLIEPRFSRSMGWLPTEHRHAGSISERHEQFRDAPYTNPHGLS